MRRHGLHTPQGGPAVSEFRIGLAPIAIEDWFEGGEGRPADRKDPLFRALPQLTWGECEGSRPAQAEAADMVAAWLDQPLQTNDAPPLKAAARLVEDDLCLMQKISGEWVLSAACLCSPSFFSAKDAVGLPLSGLHAPVPGFNDTFLARVTRIFDHLASDQIVERRNWTLVNDVEPFQPDPTPFRARLSSQSLEEIAASLHVRRERQTLRRTPVSGAILFTIRIWTEPLDELLKDPQRHKGFAAAWDEVMGDKGEAFRLYKRLDLFDGAIRYRLKAKAAP